MPNVVPVDQPRGVLERHDSTYPQRLLTVLGKKSPREIAYIGNIDLLQQPSIGFCGSRKASSLGLEVAADSAEQIARLGLVVVSGNASGIDIQTHRSALMSGGSTILVLPEGINNFRIKNQLKDVWDWDRVLVVSQFLNNAIWTGYRAMERNLTIIGLSGAMIVIESGEQGGTFHAGMSSLRLNRPLYVVNYGSRPDLAPGNAKLIQFGANVLNKSKATGRAKVEEVVSIALSETRGGLF